MPERGLGLLYPDRKRCRACRRYFGFLVVDGLYDSYECAGRPRPEDTPPDLWPREHYVPKPGGVRQPKAVFFTERAAQRAAERHGKEAYRCSFCRDWHIGSRNPIITTDTGWIVHSGALDTYDQAYRATGDRASALDVLFELALAEDRRRSPRRTLDLAAPPAPRSGCRPLGCACAGGLGYCSGDS
ncbi:MAG TPA: hypothetical protein VFU47_04340 [Armatimonadota bacterium]|nr:hypothetical protein [Armatimonadota bacterium]